MKSCCNLFKFTTSRKHLCQSGSLQIHGLDRWGQFRNECITTHQWFKLQVFMCERWGVVVWETKVFMDWRILRKNLMLWGRSHWSLMLVICSSNHPIINTKRVRKMHQNNFKVRSLSWFLARTGSDSINVNLLEPSSCFSVESHFYHSIHRVFEVVPTCESVCVIWFSCKKCMTWEHKKELPGRPFTMDFSVILTGNIKVMWPEETSWDFPQWQSPEMSQPF